ncbi:phage antirepressor KilAC domain-containing protein [Bacillus mycoides]|uniref:phage antirepressor KilAC domain-containing protein n=1 Tax=Bacillus mycoides TaxID=1405 RepID=UPI0021CD501E|nr:phage antirepressor KilAC domain-containing protein [Bacillus mycoides]MCU5655949.1 phage antirepressor KilAC domain-containing protein [Bacillus mycoides]
MGIKAENLVIELNFGEETSKQAVKPAVQGTATGAKPTIVEADVFTEPSNVAQREKYIERIEVLSKVKGLLLLPQLEMATTKQVAAFYEVPHEAISTVIRRNIEELEGDGMYLARYSEIKEVINGHNDHLLSLGVSKRGTYVFPKRAILRIGMLLRDSATAKEVRTQLLNIEEHATNQQRTQEIDKDGLLLLDIIRAKDPIKQAQAIAAYTEYKDARAKEAEEKAAKYEEKAGKFDLVTEQAGLLTLTSVGKSYVDGVSANALNKFLIQRGVLYKKKVDGIHMYKKGYEKYFKVVTYEAGYRTLKVTLEGALFIADLYKEQTSEKSA